MSTRLGRAVEDQQIEATALYALLRYSGSLMVVLIKGLDTLSQSSLLPSSLKKATLAKACPV